MYSHLIALDKSHGVIICRSIVMVTRTDIADLCGVNQLCSGVKGGIEGAFHAMKELFEANRASGWGLLLVDANNAFNSFNWVAAYGTPAFSGHVVQGLCSTRIVVMLLLWYKKSTMLNSYFVKRVSPKEDPLSMLMYAAALMLSFSPYQLQHAIKIGTQMTLNVLLSSTI